MIRRVLCYFDDAFNMGTLTARQKGGKRTEEVLGNQIEKKLACLRQRRRIRECDGGGFDCSSSGSVIGRKRQRLQHQRPPPPQLTCARRMVPDLSWHCAPASKFDDYPLRVAGMGKVGN